MLPVTEGNKGNINTMKVDIRGKLNKEKIKYTPKANTVEEKNYRDMIFKDIKVKTFEEENLIN